MDIESKAKEMRREYARKWRAKNKDKVKAANERYWLKKAADSIESENEERSDEHGKINS